MKVKANFDYNDVLLERLVKKDDVIEVDEARGKLLTTKLYNGVPFCNVVEELKPLEPKEESKGNLGEDIEEKPKKRRTRKAKVEE